MNTTAYDVVIVTFNNAKIIAEVLRALYASRPAPHQVIVYDSGSTDDTCLVIKQQFPQVTLLEGENRGFGTGNNAGVRAAKSEYVLFVNPDLKVAPDCAKLLVASLETDPQLAIATPLIYRGWNERTREVCAFGGFIDRAGFAYSNIVIDKEQPTNCFSGACFLARRATMLRFPFEERNFLYYEELDLTVQLLKAGYRVGKVQEASCWHIENYSSPEKNAGGISFRQFHGIQNRWFALGRHWPGRLLLYALALNAAHLAFFLLFFLRHRHWRYLSLLGIAPGRFFLGLWERLRYTGTINHSFWYHSLRRTSFKDARMLKQRVLQTDCY